MWYPAKARPSPGAQSAGDSFSGGWLLVEWAVEVSNSHGSLLKISQLAKISNRGCSVTQVPTVGIARAPEIPVSPGLLAV